MKSKKKLLLMGVGVMGALAMGVGATSTFAWYQAGQSATVAAGIAKDTGLSVGDPNYGLTSTALPVSVTFSRVTDGTGDAVTGNLELTKWYESAPTISDPVVEINGKTSGWTPALERGLYAGTLDSGSKLHLFDEANAQKGKYVAVYKCHITAGPAGMYGGISWTDGAIQTELAKRKAQIDLSAAKYVAVAVNDPYDAGATYVNLSAGVATPTTPTNDGSKITAAGPYKLVTDTENGRIRFLSSTSTTVTRADGAKTYTLNEISLAGIASGVDAYFGVRVEAEATVESGYVYAPFTAAVADDGSV